MKKILICDDEEGIRESLKLILEDHYDLILTDNGQQCLDCLAASNEIGLIFLDIKMPQTNGLDILNLIRKNHPQLPVVMITGYKSVETASEAVRLGATSYIIKPFKSEEILGMAKTYLK